MNLKPGLKEKGSLLTPFTLKVEFLLGSHSLSSFSNLSSVFFVFLMMLGMSEALVTLFLKMTYTFLSNGLFFSST